jgi:hypothetical protein
MGNDPREGENTPPVIFGVKALSREFESRFGILPWINGKRPEGGGGSGGWKYSSIMLGDSKPPFRKSSHCLTKQGSNRAPQGFCGPGGLMWGLSKARKGSRNGFSCQGHIVVVLLDYELRGFWIEIMRLAVGSVFMREKFAWKFCTLFGMFRYVVLGRRIERKEGKEMG